MVLGQHSGDQDYRNKAKIWANLAQSHAFYAYDFWLELQENYTFASTSGVEKVFMPSNFDKPTRLWDFTNNNKMSWITREAYVDANTASVADGVTGQPQQAMLYGVNAVSVEPSSFFTVQVKSSSMADSGGFTVRVEGWLDAAKTILGHEDIAIDTANPTTYVAGTMTYYGITRFVKSGNTQGSIILATSTPTILATIAPYDRQSRYPVIYLGLIPNAAINYHITYKGRMHRMVEDNDYPFAELDDFITFYGCGMSFTQEKESQSRAEQMFKKADECLLLAIRNSMAKMGTAYQHKAVPSMAQAMRR